MFTRATGDPQPALSMDEVLAFAEANDNEVGGCRLFRWQHAQRVFELLQALLAVLPTAAPAYDVETFLPTTGEKALVLVHEEKTLVYDAVWHDGNVSGFRLVQELQIPHGRDAEHFRWAGLDLLAVSVFRSEQSYEVETLIFQWDVTTRQLNQAACRRLRRNAQRHVGDC
eukprot:Skav200974  [mRNA]  locus=scaffold448:790411:800575:- [translate_table: standard]